MGRNAAYDFARGIIGRVSRTFALGIVLLPGDLRKAVMVSYLLCRIADTIEDDGDATPQRRQALLARFVECFGDPKLAAPFAAEVADIQGDDAYLELLAGAPLVFELLGQLPKESVAIIERWVREMARGMSDFVGRYPHGIRIQTLDEYRKYCYYVAGTVGHILTELWCLHSRTMGERDYARLLPNCEAFGEALQTVNIIKDIPWDIERENAAFIPEDILLRTGGSHQTILLPEKREQNREGLNALTKLAREDLYKSLEYFDALPKTAVKIRLFCLLPILFAFATLREIDRSTAMLQSDGAVKITRDEVRALMMVGPVAALSNALTHRLVARINRAPFVLRLG